MEERKRPVLFINACVRNDSRTKRLADKLLAKLDRPVEEIKLSAIDFPKSDEDFLELRGRLIEDQKFDHPLFKLAREFSQADCIVIAAPYWDLSFPAALKQYIEQINVVGITFRYSPEGAPIGLCRADRIYYVATAGGHFVPEEFGFGYVKALAKNYYGISDVRLIRAVGLDIDGADEEAIMKEAEDSIINMDLS